MNSENTKVKGLYKIPKASKEYFGYISAKSFPHNETTIVTLFVSTRYTNKNYKVTQSYNGKQSARLPGEQSATNCMDVYLSGVCAVQRFVAFKYFNSISMSQRNMGEHELNKAACKVSVTLLRVLLIWIRQTDSTNLILATVAQLCMQLNKVIMMLWQVFSVKDIRLNYYKRCDATTNNGNDNDNNYN
ncbi:hypothetical protein GQX74_011690 [Glossina fuscipes]|nr:hypothetical protein GQX74_011690 [Glossina fuscipes]